MNVGMHLFRRSPRSNLPNNGLAIFDDADSVFCLRSFCRSASMSSRLDGTNLSSNSFFAIARQQPGKLLRENTVGSQSALRLTASQQGI